MCETRVTEERQRFSGPSGRSSGWAPAASNFPRESLCAILPAMAPAAEDKEGGRLREAARRLREERSSEASRVLVELTFSLIERGIAVAARRSALPHERELLAEQAFNAFLEEKLDDDDFLDRVARADCPEGLVVTSAQHVMHDLLRTRQLAPRRVETERADVLLDSPGADGPDPAPDAVELWEAYEDQLTARSVLASLSPTDLLLVKVVHADMHSLTPAELEGLASRRGMPASAVQREIDARVEALQEHRKDAQETLENRRVRVRSLLARTRRVVTCMRDLDEEVLAFQGYDAVKRPSSWSHNALLKLTTEERRVVLGWLDDQLKTAERLLEEAREEAHKGGPPDWRQVAWILGRIRADSTTAEARTAVNTTTAQYGRLRSRILQLSTEQGGRP